MIGCVHSVRPQVEVAALGNLEPLEQIHIQLEDTRTGKEIRLHAPHLPGLGIH